jgi:hypothetical protein
MDVRCSGWRVVRPRHMVGAHNALAGNLHVYCAFWTRFPGLTFFGMGICQVAKAVEPGRGVDGNDCSCQ